MITDKQLLLLHTLDEAPLRMVVTTGRPQVPALERLVELGYASAHRSSIGEIDEKATYSITDKGRAVVTGKS